MLDRSAIVRLLLSLAFLMMCLWLVLSKSQIVKFEPTKLFHLIHPSYYIGLIMLLILLKLSLFHKLTKKSHLILLILLSAFYIQYPPLAIFSHIINSHTIHMGQIFFILRYGTILNVPEYVPGTISPQLFAATYIQITSLPSPIENIHKLFIIFMPVFVSLIMYTISRELGLSNTYAAIASIFCLGLLQFSFTFLRQTFAIPLWLMLNLLFLRILERQHLSDIVSLVLLMIPLVSTDPAFVYTSLFSLVTFLALMVTLGFVMRRGRENVTIIKFTITLLSLLIILFYTWTSTRLNCNEFRAHIKGILGIMSKRAGLLSVVKYLKEKMFGSPRIYPYGGNVPTSLTVNSYYGTLLKVRILIYTVSSIITCLFYLTLLVRSHKTIEWKTWFTIANFVATSFIYAAGIYGAIYAPWLALGLFYSLNLVYGCNNISLKGKSRLLLMVATAILVASAVIVAPHIIVLGKFKLDDKTMALLSFLDKYWDTNSKFSITSIGEGRWLRDIIYFMSGKYIPIHTFFLCSVSSSIADNLLHRGYNVLMISYAASLDLEKTSAIYKLPEFFSYLVANLGKIYSLVYSSGLPFATIWVKD